MAVTFTFQPPALNAIVALAAARKLGEMAGAEVLLEKSRALAPRDTGTMADTAHVEQDDSGAAVVYDATSPEGYLYPERQHEDLSLHHPHGGEAKFLEKPMHSEHAAIGAAMLAPVEAVFR